MSSGVQSTPDPGILGSLKRLAEASVILGALLYLSGWSYLYSYYATFGLSVGDLDLPIQIPLIYSFPVVFTWPIILTVGGLITAFWLGTHRWAYTRFGYLARAFASSTSMLVVCLLLLGKLLSQRGFDLGQRAAAENMLKTTKLYAVDFKMKDEQAEGSNKNEDGIIPPARLCRPGADYHLLAHMNKQYFLVVPVAAVQITDAGGALRVCVIPDDRVAYIQPQAPVPNPTGVKP